MNFDDNVSDYLDSTGKYSSESDGYGHDGYSVPAESSAPSSAAPRVTGNAQVSPLRTGLEALRLGEFTPTQICYVRPLSRLAWAYLATMAEGRSYDALGILSVYRALFNSQRGAIVGGLSPAAQSAWPSSLPEIAWTEPMRLSMQIVLSATTGGRADRNQALARMPSSAVEIASWFNASRGLFDESAMRAYLEVPRVGGEELAASVMAAVQDDIARCLSPAPTIGPATGIAPVQCPPGSRAVGGRCVSVSLPQGTPTTSAPPRQNPQGGGGSVVPWSRPSSGSGGGQGLLLVLLAALAAGAWWVYRDDEKKAALRELPEDE